MSKIHFLSDKIKNDIFEFPHSRQNWRYLVEYILNNNEYKIEENERIYKVHNLPLLCLPTRKIIRSILVQVGSVLQYSIIKTHIADIMIIPSLVKDQTEEKRNILPRQKRVTIIPPNNTLNKQSSFVENDFPSIDEQHYSLLDSHRKFSLPPNQRSSDDLRQRIINAIRRNSYQDEPLIRKRHYDNHLSRLSLRSISYDFGLGIKTIHNQTNLISSLSNYRLPSNKIELDIIHHTESLKKSL